MQRGHRVVVDVADARIGGGALAVWCVFSTAGRPAPRSRNWEMP
jgi:hypothetical protein